MHQHTQLCRSGYFSDCINCRHTADDLLTIPPSYDDLALVVKACDDVLPYLRPLCKTYYHRELRPCLVAFIADSESDPDSSDSEADGCVRENQPAVKRVRKRE
jgi:hypothetical protein